MYVVRYCWLICPQMCQKNSPAEVEADYIIHTHPPAPLTAPGYPPVSFTMMMTGGSSQKAIGVDELGGNWWIHTHHRHLKLTCLEIGLPLFICDGGDRPPPPGGRLVTIEGYDDRRFLGKPRLGAADGGGLPWKSSSWWSEIGGGVDFLPAKLSILCLWSCNPWIFISLSQRYKE